MLITDDGARLIDWAWPTLGAAWLDPACWVLRLIVAGHTAEGAERWARRVPAWQTATRNHLSMFAVANARLWDEIATSDPKPLKARMRAAARSWADHRKGVAA
ncbi:MAG: hypothetical protein M3083_17340 [Actinomycetota bacterium]|nr:hypothetical protein [Actinomycetota bacterium]